MDLSYFYELDTWIISSVLSMLMLIAIYIGRRFGRNRSKDYADNPGTSAVTASLYGLLGLLLAFTFGMSGERFKDRKETIVKEANAIISARSRVRLYADSVQPLFQTYFDRYINSRVHYYQGNADTSRIKETIQEGSIHADELWNLAIHHSKINGNLLVSSQMIPALSQMFELNNAQFLSEYNRTPASILTMLFTLSVSAAFVAGHTSIGKGIFDWWMAIGFCLLTSMVIFFIIDLDKPRRGLITLDKYERAITDLRDSKYR